MKRLLMGVIACSLLVGAVAFSRFQKPVEQPQGDLVIELENRNPWTHLRVNNNPHNFQFLIVSDRTGGHRPKIFSQAVHQVNLLQPEFVLSVGDLIEGYTEDKEQIDKEWKEFQSYVNKLKMPFFYVPGNHDYTNEVMTREWKQRFGRSYYHFVYKDVLFLLLNTDDPPGRGGNISQEQIEFARKVLKENRKVRWTIVAMHKPLWSYRNLEENGWLEVEKALGERPYTVFAGHRHHYYKFKRNGRNYYQLATTGGGSRLRGIKYGEFDHVVWVTMSDKGPVLANIMLDGIYPENLKKTLTNEAGYPYDIRRTYPVTGRILFQGQPLHNAQVVFHYLDEKKKRVIRAGDALTEEDGTFKLTTYKDYDGAPLGKYAITITQRDPFYRVNGEISPNQLPEKYADRDTSGLRVEVTKGPNEFTFELTR